ncbi:MAG: hypothetical protein PHI19_02340 [Clostridia bacterium]|nr:hypothetical protein [Clostridia bacterium]
MKIKKLSKQALAAIIILSVLAIAFAIFLPFYLKSNEENRRLYAEEKIKFSAFGEELGSYTLEELLALEGVQEAEFTDYYDTSISEPVEKTYTGIELGSVLTALGVDMREMRTATFKASDGAVKIYTYQEIRQENNVYIAYKVNGKPFERGIDGLGYTRDTEDGGPFVVIKVSDTFSNNRCKLLTEVIIA